MPTIEPVQTQPTIITTAHTKMPSQILSEMKGPVTPTAPEAPLSEQPKEQTTAPTEDEKRFQALTLKEKQLLKERQELKRLKEELQNKYKPWEEAQEVAKQSKIEALKRLGISYDDVTNEFLGAQNMTPEQIAEAKANAIVEERLKAFEEQQKQQNLQMQQKQYDMAIKQIKFDAKALAESSENYPLVKATQAYDTVVELMESTHNDSDRLMSVEEATKQVESDLKTYVLDLVKIPQIRSEIQALLQQQGPTQLIKPEKSLTLTNKTTASPALAADVSSMNSAQKEAYYRQRAIDLLEGRIS